MSETKMTPDEFKAELKRNMRDRFPFLSRHLVSLGGTCMPLGEDGEPTGDAKPFVYAGFILSVRGVWCLVTAGHVMQYLENYRRDSRIGLAGYVLSDRFGPEVNFQNDIPFDYQRRKKFHIDDEKTGLDFGFIVLSSYYRGLLEKNNISPVPEVDWAQQQKLEFDSYLMLGFQQDFIEPHPNESNGEVMPVIAGVIDMDVTKMDSVPEGYETIYPRFVGRVSSGVFNLPSGVIGMSGGPIFGLRFAENSYSYSVVAVQSCMLRDNRIIFGCPSSVFMPMIEEKLTTMDIDE